MSWERNSSFDLNATGWLLKTHRQDFTNYLNADPTRKSSESCDDTLLKVKEKSMKNAYFRVYRL